MSHATKDALMIVALPEIGCYGLAGHTDTPRDVLAQARRAEELGLGSMFLSERFTVKDAGVLAGAVGAVTERLGIGTAATNHNTRHPLITATMATTLHRMTGGRYAFGLGRGFDALFDVIGLPRVTSAQLVDVVGVYRRLWHGEAVVGHDGPAGKFPYLSQDSAFDEDIPILMTAIGGRTLELAGRLADGVVLHTFLTDEALAKSVATIRRAAEESGRDPASVRIWAVLATVHDRLPEEIRLRKLVGRLATYLQGYGEVLVRANGWDLSVLERFRADPLVRGYPGAFDAVGSTADLAYLRDEVLPAEWLAACAHGDAAACAARIKDQFAAGADGVILHGATPDELAPVLAAWREVRPAAAFDHLPANPGRAVV
jgi:probable F420-dependent oxidoreductase